MVVSRTNRWLIPIGLLIAVAGFTGTRGGRAWFNPYTLRYYTQSEFTVLGGSVPVYRSWPRPWDNPTLKMVREEGYVAPVPPADGRTIEVFHWNEAWRDGSGELHYVLGRDRDRVMKWRRENPARARIYWQKAFDHFRSEGEHEVGLGSQILYMGHRMATTEELGKFIAELEAEVASWDDERPRAGSS